MTHKVRITNIHKWTYEDEISKAFGEQLGLTPYVDFIFLFQIIVEIISLRK